MNEKKNDESISIDLPKKNNAPNTTKKSIPKKAEKKPKQEPNMQKIGDINAKPAKAEKAKSPIKMNIKQASNDKLAYAPKRKSPNSNAQNIDAIATPKAVGNKHKDISAQKVATNVTETNNTIITSAQTEKNNPEKLKKHIPRVYKPKKSEENSVKLAFKPKNNPKTSQSKINNSLNKSIVNTNKNNVSAPNTAIKLRTDQEKINPNDTQHINENNNISAHNTNILTEENSQHNISFKKTKPLRSTTAKVEQINSQDESPAQIEQTKPKKQHINKAQAPIKQTPRTAIQARAATSQGQKATTQKQKPTTQKQISTIQEQKPITQEQISSTREQKPITQEQISSTQEQKPTTQEHKSTTQEQKPIAQEQISARQEHKPIAQEHKSTTQEHKPITQEQKYIKHAQSKPRRPRNYSGVKQHSPKEIINAQNAHGENTSNNDKLDHKASNIPFEKNNTKQINNKASKAKIEITPKVLPKATKHKQCKMLISVVPGEQVEVVVIENNSINEYYLEMFNQKKTKGNIYKGIIHNIDTNLQAAFINYGTNKNGFLQIDEVHPEYYTSHQVQTKGKKFPPMQKVLKTKQEVLVQVVKEPSGNKGAFLTTWPSLAGRFLVLTPGQTQIGVSRKVVDEEERVRLRNMINGIEPGEGLGVIIRTASEGISKTTLKNDLQYLKRLWKDIRKKVTSETAPALVYQELALAERAMRDYLNDDIFEVWVDDASVADSLRETASLLFPRKKDLIKIHTDMKQSLWEKFNLQQQLKQIYSREVILPSGGRLIFDQTEALMAIDINSGKISGKNNFETMALKTNVEAAECIAHQLKLRDIGGQIVIDFIEMRDKNHIRDVEKTLRNAMRNDRARHDVGRISSFGLLEMVRQRTASSAIAVSTEPCPLCAGTGIRRNIEWQALQTIRDISRSITSDKKSVYQVELNTELALYFLNYKRESLHALEKQYGVKIEIKINHKLL